MMVIVQNISDSTPRMLSGVVAGAAVEHLLQRIQRAGADVAVDHAQRASVSAARAPATRRVLLALMEGAGAAAACEGAF
jgi:hypothetical protein